MKAVSYQRKPQYTNKNQNGTKPHCTKRGNSVQTFRNKSLEIQDNEPISLSNLIIQSPKECSTSGHSTVSSSNRTFNSPKPNTARPKYSLSPCRVTNIVKIIPPKSLSNSNKKTLVLDLDETLVHSGFRPFNISSDIILKIELENKIHDIHVLVRPGVEEFLQRMAKHYEIIIFTASLSKYADPLLDQLDNKKACAFRLFREHCTMINNAFVKDLRKLDRDLKDLLIVDNNPMSYALNVENGVPIKTWYEDKNDRELYNIAFILEFLAYVPDVREYIKQMVEKNEFSYPRAMTVINNTIAQKESQMRSLTPIIALNSKNNFFTGLPLKDTSFHYHKDKEREHNQAYGSNLTASSTMNYKTETSINLQSPKEKKGGIMDNKQINIKIINNNFTNYILNSQDSASFRQESSKPSKGINTFRSSNTHNVSQVMGSPNKREMCVSSPNSVNNNRINNGRYNIKSLNINMTSNEVRSPVLRSSQQNVKEKSFNSNIAKYSSLIDQEKENSQNHSIMNNNNTLYRNYSKPNLSSINHEISIQSYMRNSCHNVQTIKEITSNINAGHHTARPSTCNARLKINLSGTSNNPQSKYASTSMKIPVIFSFIRHQVYSSWDISKEYAIKEINTHI